MRSMKKVIKKFKQSLSILLAVAMVVTCVPQTATLALAAEADTNAIDAVVEDTAELEVSTVDAAAPGEDTEEISEEGGEVPVQGSEDVVVNALAGEVSVLSIEEASQISFPENQDVEVKEDSKNLVTSGSESFSFEAKAADDSNEIKKVTAVVVMGDSDSKEATLSTDDTDAKRIESETENGVTAGYTKYTVPLTSSALGEAYSAGLSDTKSITITFEVGAIDAGEPATTYTITLPDPESAHATVTLQTGYTGSAPDSYKTVADTNLTFKVQVTENYKLIETKPVTYDIESGASDQEPTETDGTYTIDSENITGNITINVVTEEDKKEEEEKSYTASFKTCKGTYKSSAATEYDSATDHYTIYTVTRNADKTYSNATKVEDGKIAFAKDESIYIALELEEKYAVQSARVDGKVRTISETTIDDKTYSVFSADKLSAADTTITITVFADKDTANEADFSTASDDNYTITLTNDDYARRLAYTEDGYRYSFYTALDSVSFTVKPSEGYYVEKVEKVIPENDNETVSGTDSDSESKTGAEITVSCDFSSADTPVEYLVYVSAIPVTGETTITFDLSNAGSFTLNVTEGATEKLPAETEGQKEYTIAAETQYVEFELSTENAKVVPVVIIGETSDEDEPNVWESITSESPYQYKISASLLAKEGNETITVTEAKVPRTLTLVYDEESLVGEYDDEEGDEPWGIHLFVDGKDVDCDWQNADNEYVLGYEPGDEVDGKTVDIYTMPVDTEVTVKAYVKGSYEITSYQLNDNTTEMSGQSAEIPVTLTDDTKLTINTKTLISQTLYDSENDVFVEPNKDGVYEVDFGKRYTAFVRNGEVDVDIESIKKDPETGIESTVTLSHNEVTINVAAADAGKTFTVTLYPEADQQGDVIAVYTLKVKAALNSVAIEGVNKEGKLTQTVDTVQEYKLTPDPVDASLDGLGLGFDWANGHPSEKETVEGMFALSDGSLVVTTPAVKADEFETLVTALSDVSVKLVKSENSVATFTPVLAAPTVLQGATPTVAKKSVTDVSLNLTLSTPASVKLPSLNAGKYWYAVTVTPDNEEKLAENNIKPAATYYFEKTDAASQNNKIDVFDAPAGFGKPWKFTVSVKLVQAVNDTDLKEYPDQAKNVLTGFASKEPYDTKTIETVAPSYETKLTLKKGTTTVYTGQSRVKIATANFTKNTTFKAIDPDKIVDQTVAGDLAQYVSFDADDDGSIYMSVDVPSGDESARYDSRLIGSHTIKVTAEAPDDSYAASATIKVNVVRGIQDLEVTAPNYLYRASNTKVTLKPTITYNLGKTGTYAPKKKSVTYALAGPNKEDNFTLAGVSVNAKNGTVTVDKSFTENTTDPSKNTFTIKATATDYNNNTCDYSEPIQISSQAMQLGDVCIVEPIDGQETVYRVIARENSEKKTFQSNELNGKKVVVLKKSETAKDTYSEEEIFSANNVTFKSSKNKALSIAADGTISINKVDTNITITATAKDGSKRNEAKLTGITVETRPINLGLLVRYADSYEIGWQSVNALTDPNTKPLEFCGTTDTALQLEVVEVLKNENGDEYDYTEIGEISNFKAVIKSGGKALSTTSTYGTGQYITFVATGEKVVVELSYPVNGKTQKSKFTILNTGYSTAKSPAVKLTNLKAGYYNGEQFVTVTAENTKKSGSSYVFDDKSYALVEFDKKESSNAKKKANYDALEAAADGQWNAQRDPRAVYKVDENTGTFDLYYNNNNGQDAPAYTNIPAGSYKLHITFGTQSVNGEFVPTTKTSNVTLKAVAQGKTSYKPVSKVKMSVEGTPSVALHGTGKNFTNEKYYADSLKDVIINGQPNGFIDYFELKEVTDRDWNGNEQVETWLELKGDEGILSAARKRGSDAVKAYDEAMAAGSQVTEAAQAELKQKAIDAELTFLASKDAKNIRSGYVTYSVDTLGGSLFKSDTVKITVDFVAENKINSYKAAAVTILAGQTEARIDITAGKNPASIAYAYVEPGTAAKDGGFRVNANDIDRRVINDEGKTIDYDSQVVLNTETATPAGKNFNKIALYVVPSNSYHLETVNGLCEKYDKAATENKDTALEALQKAIRDYGVPVTATVKTVAPNKSGNKIALAGTKYSFTNTHTEYADGTTANYDIPSNNYWIDIPYKTLIPSGVTEVKVVNNSSVSANDPGSEELVSKELFMVSVHDSWRQKYEEGLQDNEITQDYLSIAINKDVLAAADAKGLLKYDKKNVQVKLELSFGSVGLKEGSEDQLEIETNKDIKKQNITLKLNMPSKQEKSWEKLADILTDTKKAEIEATALREWPSWDLNDDQFSYGTMTWNYNNEEVTFDDSYAVGGGSFSDTDNDKNLSRYWTLTETTDNVWNAIVLLLPADSNIEVGTPNRTFAEDGSSESLKVGKDQYKAASSLNDGFYKVEISLENMAVTGTFEEKETNGNAKIVTFEIKLPKSGEEPKDFEGKLYDFVDQRFGDPEKEYVGESKVYDYAQSLMAQFKSNYRDENWTENWNDVDEWMFADWIRDAARLEAKLVDEDGKATNSLRMNIEDYELSAPAGGVEGYIQGNLHVWGPRYGGDEVYVPFKFRIPALVGMDEVATVVKDAIDGLLENPSNQITDEMILDEARRVNNNPNISIDFATITEEDVENDTFKTDDAKKWVLNDPAFKKVDATRNNDGFIRFILQLTNESPVDGEDTVKRLDPYYFEIEKQADIEAASNAIKQELGMDGDDVISSVPGEIVSLIIRNNNKEDAVKNAILKAAQDAVEKDGYSVEYKTTKAGEGVDEDPTVAFTFEPAYYKGRGASDAVEESDKGTIGFTLVITDDLAANDDSSTEDDDNDDVTGNTVDADDPAAPVVTKELELPELELVPNAGYESLDEAYAELKSWLDAKKDDSEDPLFTSSIVKESVEGFNLTSDLIKYTAEIKKAASDEVVGAGKITITFNLKKYESAVDETTLLDEKTFEYEADYVQTMEEAVAAATVVLETYASGHEGKGANKDLQTKKVSSDMEDEENTITTLSDDIKAVIITAVEQVIDTNRFKADIDDMWTDQNSKKASRNGSGKVQFRVDIYPLEDGEPNRDDPEVKGETKDISWEIDQLEYQVIEEAEQAAKAAIEAYRSAFETSVSEEAKTELDFDAEALVGKINESISAALTSETDNVALAAWTAIAGTDEGDVPKVTITKGEPDDGTTTFTYSGKIILTCDEEVYAAMEDGEFYPASLEINLGYLNPSSDDEP